MKAIRITETGGPEVMKLVDVEVGKPGPGQVRVRQTAIGLNYIDTYHRSGPLSACRCPPGSASRRRASSRSWARG